VQLQHANAHRQQVAAGLQETARQNSRTNCRTGQLNTPQVDGVGYSFYVLCHALAVVILHVTTPIAFLQGISRAQQS
jgi:hypothetical protein